MMDDMDKQMLDDALKQYINHWRVRRATYTMTEHERKELTHFIARIENLKKRMWEGCL
jgi:hypothetical protein